MGRQSHWAVRRRRYHRNRDILADTLKRHLLITRRRIPLDRAEDYARLWHDVRRKVGHGGGRAWIFRSRRSGDHFTEFVEWQSDEEHPLNEQADIADVLASLNAAFPAEGSDTWIEAKI